MISEDHIIFEIILCLGEACIFRLNILAELLRFGDREFYKDWWNAKTVEEVGLISCNMCSLGCVFQQAYAEENL